MEQFASREVQQVPQEQSKHGLHNTDVVQTLVDMVVWCRSRNCNLLTESDERWRGGRNSPLICLTAEGSDIFHPTMLTRMLVSHSKYLLVLEESQVQSGSRPCHIIQMLHCLVVSQQADREQSSASPGLAEAEVNLAGLTTTVHRVHVRS